MKRVICTVLCLILALSLAACGQKTAETPTAAAAPAAPAATEAPAAPAAPAKLSGTVSTDGSTSMEKVIGALGEAFMEANPDVTFTYNPTGSGSGIQAVQEGRCDIGLSSRALKDDEKAAGLTETILCYDGIAIIVNPANKVEN
ncbi:MAG: lipoprotein, partial [Faecousia sp.]